MKIKKCPKCEEEKSIDNFSKDRRSKSGLTYFCKECNNKKAKEYRKANKEVIKIKRKNYIELNKEQIKKQEKTYKKLNDLKIKCQKKEYREKNKDEIKRYQTKYKESNMSKQKEYYEKNKEKFKEYNKKYLKERIKTDDVFRFKKTIKNLIAISFRNKGYKKSGRTCEILSCSLKEFKLYIENKFEPWMNWENRGKYNGEFSFGWDIDHIIPISTAKCEEDVVKLNHYTNLRPLCSHTNRDIKKNKIVFGLNESQSFNML